MGRVGLTLQACLSEGSDAKVSAKAVEPGEPCGVFGIVHATMLWSALGEWTGNQGPIAKTERANPWRLVS